MHIEISGLTKVYKGGHRALDGVDLRIDGGMLGLLGANGAGKTTLMRVLTGTVRPTSGRVAVGGHDLATGAGRTAAKRMIGYLPQELTPYPDLTGREFLDYLALLKGVGGRRARRARIDGLLAQVGLEEEGGRRIAGYSGGMRRRIGIAQSLLGDPRLIIVDEPTAGLDPEERMRFRSLLASLGRDRTVLLSTHILDDVGQSCPHAAVLDRGRVVFQGRTGELAQAAAGRAFEVPADAPLPADAAVVGAAGAERRIVTDAPPPGARPVAPTLEEGFTALLRSVRAGERP
ncbi:ATP-binding cassette domain-containing protein [Nocardiopsis potens]|uniref:ATP-binding cassette domain-containing protein n=1 Tax=Nocardiopsis potens TaxID=1246458 RepID=UPI0003467CE5|nr:ATP-binding cassette domain-containing protein [Nocardiopsis potens]